MRCSRCDQIIIRQAIGKTIKGVLVFGWCFDCMRDEGCLEVEVAERSKLSRHRKDSQRKLVLTDVPIPVDPKIKMVRGVAAGIATWAGILLSAGVIRLFSRQADIAVSGLANGAAGFFIAAGLGLAIFAAIVHSTTWTAHAKRIFTRLLVTVLSGLGSVALCFVALWGMGKSSWLMKAPLLVTGIGLAFIAGWHASSEQRALRQINVPTQARRQPQNRNL